MENNYDSVHIPYGRRFNAKNIEKLMFKRDIVLNAEWNPKNVPPQRLYKLHRHPCFFGDMHDVLEDCCGYCPEPGSAEEIVVQKEEDEKFVRGKIMFMVDDPGRQSIGSFHPITMGIGRKSHIYRMKLYLLLPLHKLILRKLANYLRLAMSINAIILGGRCFSLRAMW